MLKVYGNITLADFEDAYSEEECDGADYARVCLPASAETEILMQRQSFFWADRTLYASISLGKIPSDLDKFMRLPILETSEYKEDILRIATASFKYDRRFHLAPDCSVEISQSVLQQYVAELDKCLVAMYKDKVVGFLALKETQPDSLFVHLAAVDEKYRMTGAALALYGRACQIAKERGYKKLEGRISSQNMAVMNVYAFLGAVFSDAKDIFIKELKHDA